MHELRKKAEAVAAASPQTPAASAGNPELEKVLHEMQVQRIELEIQNEELRSAQKALEDARNRYARLYQNAPVGYVIIDPAGLIKQTNLCFEKMLNGGAGLHGKPFADLLVPDDAAIFRSRFKVMFKNPSGKKMEVRLRQKGSDPLYVQLEAMPHHEAPFSEGFFDELLMAVVDVSERRHAELGLKTALAESQRHSQETAALLQGARAILLQEDFQTTARKVFDICSGLIGATSGYVALLSDDGEENEVLFLEAGGLPCSVDPELPMPIRGLRERAYRECAAVYHNDFMQSEWVTYLPAGHVRLENVMFSPLVLSGKTVGIIGLANKPTDFTDNDAKLAAGFGELAAIALEKGNILDERNRTEKERIALIADLKDALSRVRQLSGLLPMCSHCKKIRDDTGYWNQLEAYLATHSEAELSHGICPECAQKYYPEFDLYGDDD